jgi:hypothetical protein
MFKNLKTKINDLAQSEAVTQVTAALAPLRPAEGDQGMGKYCKGELFWLGRRVPSVEPL